MTHITLRSLKNCNLEYMFKIAKPTFADPLLCHKYEKMYFFVPRNLNSVCSPGHEDYQKIIHFYFFHQKTPKSPILQSQYVFPDRKITILHCGLKMGPLKNSVILRFRRKIVKFDFFK